MMDETGQSIDEVRRTGGKLKRFYELTGKDARGTLSTDERAEFDRLQQDAELRRGLEVQQQMQGIRAERGHDQTTDNEQRLSGSRQDSVTTRDATYADDSAGAASLVAVPPLSPVYRKAASGAQPNDTPLKPAGAVATNTITISPDNMFG